jgi:hypothetical protein
MAQPMLAIGKRSPISSNSSTPAFQTASKDALHSPANQRLREARPLLD